MAKPIEATPALEGDDAKRLLDSLKKVASSQEMERRAQASRNRLAAILAPKPR